jgi:hypothetical protein
VERITITDAALVGELERQIRHALHGGKKGEKDERGLYEVVGLGVQTWDFYNRTVGQIQALESVLKMIEEIAKSRGEILGEQVVFTKPGLN